MGIWFFELGAAIPATSPLARTPATSTAPIETYQRIAALPSTDGNRDTQRVPRKALSSSILHNTVHSNCPPPPGFRQILPSLDSPAIEGTGFGGTSCFVSSSRQLRCCWPPMARARKHPSSAAPRSEERRVEEGGKARR